MKKLLTFGLCSGVFVVFVGIALTWYVAGLLTASTNHSIDSVPAGLAAEEIVIDSTVYAWLVPHESPRGVMVLCHGIRSSRRAMVERAKVLHDEGYVSLLIDLQGHGETKGERITVGYREKENVRSSIRYIKKKYPELPVGVIGISLGGASTLLCSPLDIDALIVESVFSTLDRAVHNRVEHRLGKIGWVPAEQLLAQVSLRLGFSRNDLRPIDHIDDISCPVFVISGSEDNHTTAQETREMFNAAKEPRQLWLVQGAGHVDLMGYSPETYRERIVSFLDSTMVSM